MLQKTVTRGKTKICGKILKQIIAEESTLKATIPENESHIFRYLYTVLLYMPDYKNEPAGIEKLLPWSDFIKERCSGLIDVENQTPEHHEPLPV